LWDCGLWWWWNEPDVTILKFYDFMHSEKKKKKKQAYMTHCSYLPCKEGMRMVKGVETHSGVTFTF
jgi:hypothetical protein